MMQVHVPTTIQVQTLPTGWRNVYRQADGRYELTVSPALMLETDDSGENEVAFADSCEGVLIRADMATNYICTLSPAQPDPPNAYYAQPDWRQITDLPA